MKRCLLICLCIVAHAVGMEEGIVPCNGTTPPGNSLYDVILKLATAAYNKDMGQAMIHMGEVEEGVRKEKPTNLLRLLKQRGAYTHVIALSKENALSPDGARLLARFGALMIEASGSDSRALEDGLACVQTALASRQLGGEEKKKARQTKDQYRTLLGITKKKSKRGNEEKGASTREQDEPVKPCRNEELLAIKPAESVVKPCLFLTTQRPPFKGRTLPLKGIAGLLVRNQDQCCVNEVEKKEEPIPVKKKKKKQKKKEKKEEPVCREELFEDNWDKVAMRLLDKPYESSDAAHAYLTDLDTDFVITNPAMRNAMFAYLRKMGVNNDEVEQDDTVQPQDSPVRPVESYVMGRLLLDNIHTGDKQEFEDRGFELINIAAKSGYYPAKLYLMMSDNTGLTKRQKIWDLAQALCGNVSQEFQPKLLRKAEEYSKEGYFLPLVIRMHHAFDQGNIDTYLDELERAFPSLHLYDIDEKIGSAILFPLKIESTRWSVQAIGASVKVIECLHRIESSKDEDRNDSSSLKVDKHVLVGTMYDEVRKVEALHKDHPELKSLAGSCYSLLGRAYGWCGKSEACGAYAKALEYDNVHETILIDYIRYMFGQKNGISLQKRTDAGRVEAFIKKLIETTENYKPSAFLLYAAFHSHHKNKDVALYFLKKAEECIKKERSADTHTQEFYRDLKHKIDELSAKKTIKSMRQSKERLRGRIATELNAAFRVIVTADEKAERDPLNALQSLHNAACTNELFKMINIDDRLRTHYAAVVEKIKKAESQLSDQDCQRMVTILTELERKLRQTDEQCVSGAHADKNVKVITLSRKREGDGQ